MKIELDPQAFKQILISGGLSEAEVHEIESEFVKNNLVLPDEVLLEKLLRFNKDIYTIISLFKRIGIGESTAVRMIENHQKEELGNMIDVYTLEVED